MFLNWTTLGWKEKQEEEKEVVDTGRGVYIYS